MKRAQLQSATFARRRAAQSLRQMAQSFQPSFAAPVKRAVAKTYQHVRKNLIEVAAQHAIANTATA